MLKNKYNKYTQRALHGKLNNCAIKTITMIYENYTVFYTWIGVSGSDIIIKLSEASLIEVDMKIVDVLITSQINISITCFENNTFRKHVC